MRGGWEGGLGPAPEPPVGHVRGNACAGTPGGQERGGGAPISFTGWRTPDDTPCVEWAAVTEQVNRGRGGGLRSVPDPPPGPGRGRRGGQRPIEESPRCLAPELLGEKGPTAAEE